MTQNGNNKNTPKSPWANAARRFGITIMVVISVLGTAGGAAWGFFTKPFHYDDGANLLPGGMIGLGIGIVVGLITMSVIMYFAELGVNLRKTAENTQGSGTTAEELKQLKELLDSGVITQEEYDAKKKQLLGL